MMSRLSLNLAVLCVLSVFGTACIPFGIGGTVDGRDLDFVTATYFELRGVDPATSIEFHQIDLWLMPMEEPCESFPALLDELAELRQAITTDSVAPEDHCDSWESAFAAQTGLDGFWMAQFRLNALPRDDNQDIETEYIFVDDSSEAIPSGPHFDSSLGWYPPPTFDACAQEFSADSSYSPDIVGGDGGVATVKSYSEDDEITIQVEPSFPGDGGGLRGQAAATFCPGAADWPVEWGLGL